MNSRTFIGMVIISQLLWSNMPSLGEDVIAVGNGVGQYASIALDSKGNPHIAYWAGGRRNLLLYAFQKDGKWEVRGVDTGVYVGSRKSLLLIDDVPHIIYTDGGELRHAWREGKTWKNEVIDRESFWTGGSPQAVADKDGNIHVVYLERKGGRSWAKIKYAVGKAGKWEKEVIAESPEPNFRDVLFSRMVQYRNPSICLDEKGTVLVSYNAYSLDGAIQRLEVATRRTGTWTRKEVASPAGRYSSIGVSGGKVRVAYTSGKSLRYRESADGNAWGKEEIIDERGYVGWYVNIAATKSGPHVGYYDLQDMSLKHAWKEGGQWQKETVADGGDVGAYTSMAVTADGKAHFACFDREREALVYAIADGGGKEAPQKPQVTGVAPNPKGNTIIDRDTTWRGLDVVLDGDILVRNAKLIITCSSLRFTKGHGILCSGQGQLKRGVMPRCDGEIHILNDTLISAAGEEAYTGIGFSGALLHIADSTLERMRTLRTQWGHCYRAGIALHNPGRFRMENTVYRESTRGIYMGVSSTPVEMRGNVLYNLGGVQAIYARKMTYIGNIITSDKPALPHSATPCYVQDGLYAYNYIGEHKDHGGFNLTLGTSHAVFLHNEQGRFSSYIFNRNDSDLWVEDELSSYTDGFVHRAGGVGNRAVVVRNCVASRMKRARLDASFNVRGVVAEHLSGDGVRVLLDGAPNGWVVRDVACPVEIALYPNRDFTGRKEKLSPRSLAFIGLKGGSVSLASCEKNINFIDLEMERVLYQGRNAKRAVRFINLNPNAAVEFKDREAPDSFYGYPEDYKGWSLADEHIPYWYARVVVVNENGRTVEGARVRIVNDVAPEYKPITRKGDEKDEFVTGQDGGTSLPSKWPYRWEEMKASSEYFTLPAGRDVKFGGTMKLYAHPVSKYVKGWLVLEECDADKGVLARHSISLVGGVDSRLGEWKHVAKSVKTNTHTQYGRLILDMYSGDGDVWYDVLYVKVGDKNKLPNGSFEKGAKGWTEPDGVLQSIVEGEAKEGRRSYKLHWSFFGVGDANVVCLPDYLLKGDGSRKNFTFTITAERDGKRGILRGVDPTASWYRREPEKGVKELVVTLGKEAQYRTDEKEPPDTGPRPGIVVMEISEPSYEKKNLLPEKLNLDLKVWRIEGDWRVKNNAFIAKKGTIQFLGYSGSDFCLEADVKDPGDPHTKMGFVFRANDGNRYIAWFGVHPHKNVVLEEIRNGKKPRRLGLWTFVTPPGGGTQPAEFRARLEVGGGTIRLSFDHDMDGDFSEPFGQGYKGPITYTTRDPVFHTGALSKGRVGLIVQGRKDVLFRNLVLYGSRVTERR